MTFEALLDRETVVFMEGLLASVHVLVVLQRCCVSISVLVQQLGICVGESGEHVHVYPRSYQRVKVV